jgi:hypothetical protein
MKEGAILVGTVENRLFLARECVWQNSVGKIAKVLESGDVAFSFPMHGFTVAELRRTVLAAGFEIERIAALPLLCDIKPDSRTDSTMQNPGTFKRLLELELSHCEGEEWLEAGKNILFCCRKISQEPEV